MLRQWQVSLRPACQTTVKPSWFFSLALEDETSKNLHVKMMCSVGPILSMLLRVVNWDRLCTVPSRWRLPGSRGVSEEAVIRCIFDAC